MHTNSYYVYYDKLCLTQVPPHTDPKYLDSVLVHGDHSIEELLKCRHLASGSHCVGS